MKINSKSDHYTLIWNCVTNTWLYGILAFFFVFLMYENALEIIRDRQSIVHSQINPERTSVIVIWNRIKTLKNNAFLYIFLIKTFREFKRALERRVSSSARAWASYWLFGAPEKHGRAPKVQTCVTAQCSDDKV